MSGHTEACSESTDLCERLVAALARRIPDLRSSQSQRWCGVYRTGRPRFAYISHMKKSPRIEIWCRGDPSALKKESRINYRPRKIASGGWGPSFRGRFGVERLKDIDAAADVLYQHSYSVVLLGPMHRTA